MVATATTIPASAGQARWTRLIIAQWRNRTEVTFGEITDQMGLARHGARTFWRGEQTWRPLQ